MDTNETQQQPPIDDPFMPKAPALNGVNGGQPEPYKSGTLSPPGDRQWTDGIARLVIASAIEGDLIEKLPGAFTAALFGESSARQRIAGIIEQYTKQFTGRPTVEIIGELLRRDLATRSEAEQQAVEDEWGTIQATSLPDDDGFVMGEVRQWIEFRRMRDGLLAAREAMDRPGGLDEAREILAKGTTPTTGKSGRPFAPISAVDMTAGADEPTPWLWKPYLAKGMFGILTGYAKVGKDTFTWPLAIAISRGSRFLGMETEQTRVLFLAIEESPRTVRRRLRAEGMLPDDTGLYIWPYPMKASSLPEIKRYMVANGIGLLVISTMARWWSVENENDAAEVQREAAPLLDLAQETNAAVLVVHHDGKSDEARSSRGSSALPALVDLHLSLKRASKDPADPTRRLTVEGQREEDAVPEPVLTVEWDRQSREWSVVGGRRRERPGAESDVDKVKRAIRDGAAQASAIRLASGLSRERFEEAVKDPSIVQTGKARATRYAIKGEGQ